MKDNPISFCIYIFFPLSLALQTRLFKNKNKKQFLIRTNRQPGFSGFYRSLYVRVFLVISDDVFIFLSCDSNKYSSTTMSCRFIREKNILSRRGGG